jgi:hypothetical protein
MDEEFAIVQSGLEAYEWQFIAVCPVGTPAEGGFPRQNAKANAALIVRAVNSHDALVKALNGMVEMYADMVNSGDCGFWDPEKVKEVIAARGALSLASQSRAPESPDQLVTTPEAR